MDEKNINTKQILWFLWRSPNITLTCDPQHVSNQGWGPMFYRIIYRNFWMETEANATHTWFHTPNNIFSFLNKSRNKEMELRLGKKLHTSALRTTWTNITHIQPFPWEYPAQECHLDEWEICQHKNMNLKGMNCWLGSHQPSLNSVLHVIESSED